MIVVHSIPGSPFGRAALIGCIEKQASYRLAPLKPGENVGPEHRTRHPLGRVPAIEDDGFVVYETQAILRYHDAIGRGPALTPAGPKAAARMNQVIGAIAGYFFTRSGVMARV
jgi:glutathione S-transferase